MTPATPPPGPGSLIVFDLRKLAGHQLPARPGGGYCGRVLGAGWTGAVALAAAFAVSAAATPAGISGAVLLLPFQVSVLGTPAPPSPVRAGNLCHLRRCTSSRRRLGVASGTWACRRCRPGGGCDDSQFVGLKLIFLIVSRAVSLLRLSRRESWWKDAEILMLRHQLSVALRERPRAHSRLTWPDRAWLALLAGTLPINRLAAMRLIVTPGTVLRWHRDILRRRWARRTAPAPAGAPQCAVGGAAVGPGERVMGVPPHSR